MHCLSTTIKPTTYNKNSFQVVNFSKVLWTPFRVRGPHLLSVGGGCTSANFRSDMSAKGGGQTKPEVGAGG